MIPKPVAADRTPHYVDQHVGRRIREFRRKLGISQEKLADALGLTFQQVQKYEKGANRVSASKLFEIAATMRADIAFFFQGLPPPPSTLVNGGVAESDIVFTYDAPLTIEGAEIDRLLSTMKARRRRLVVDMARALAESDGVAGEDAAVEAED